MTRDRHKRLETFLAPDVRLTNTGTVFVPTDEATVAILTRTLGLNRISSQDMDAAMQRLAEAGYCCFEIEEVQR